jgi:hypothetical protein
MNVATLEQYILGTSDMEKSTSRNPLLLLILSKFSLSLVGLQVSPLLTHVVLRELHHKTAAKIIHKMLLLSGKEYSTDFSS